MSKLRLGMSLGLVVICLLLPILFPAEGISYISLLPPGLAVFLALISQNIFFSLGIAVVYGSILKAQFLYTPALAEAAEATEFLFTQFTAALSDTSNLMILGFVILVLTSVRLSIRAGGFKALAEWMSGFTKTKAGAERTTAFFGLMLFIDDYANTMVVGSAMQPLTDKFKISRAKLAFLVDATSAPIAGIALVSTWVGYEVGLFDQMTKTLALNFDGYDIFFSIIAYRFYCLFMILFVLYLVFGGNDFGPMLKEEQNDKGSKPITPHAKESPIPHARAHIAVSVVPILVLVATVISGLWVDGGGLNQSLFSLKAWQDVLSASENGLFILLMSSVVAFSLSFILSLSLARLSLWETAKTSFLGLQSAILPLAILLLAWSLKGVCDELKTGEYVALALGGHIPSALLPAIIFATSFVIAFATGTSWGTMSILIPTVAPLALAATGVETSLLAALQVGSSELIIFFLSMAAILDGAIFGDHCSPISDTTIMSSISSGCDPIVHVQTQMPYAVLVGVLSVVFGYIFIGYGYSLWMSFSCYLFALAVLYFLTRRKKTAA